MPASDATCRSGGAALWQAAAKSALNGRHLRPIHRHPAPKHAAQAHSNSPQASRIHQSLDKSRFIFRLSVETLERPDWVAWRKISWGHRMRDGAEMKSLSPG